MEKELWECYIITKIKQKIEELKEDCIWEYNEYDEGNSPVGTEE